MVVRLGAGLGLAERGLLRGVCRFDERLLSRLLGDEVRLRSCMAEGDGSCVFAALRREGGEGGGVDGPAPGSAR